MVIWSGKGFIVAALVFGCSLLMEAASEHLMENDDFYQQSAWAFPVAMITAGVLTAVVAFTLIPRHETNHHTLFFIPVIWWSLILPLIGLGVLIWSIFNSPADPIPPIGMAR
jgi:hypothetical protein